MRQLEKEPREDERQEVEQLRSLIVAELQLLSELQTSIVPNVSSEVVPHDDELATFDNLDDDPAESGDSSHVLDQHRTETADILPPERRLVILPSHCLNHPLRAIELSLRKQQASRYLNALWGAIADKSFQYSHIIRKAPKKAVRTRARTAISKLNSRIALYCRIYNRSQTAMVQLGADQQTLKIFQVLTTEDLKASTAIRDPNEQGASSLRLSWIWTSASGDRISDKAESVRECESASLLTNDRLLSDCVHSSTCPLAEGQGQ